MKKLIAIVTCHAPQYRERANAQRATWAKHAGYCGFDLKFFLGHAPAGQLPCDDEVFLPVDDGYHGMPAKVRAVAKWALEHCYDYLFKTDDDCYVNMLVLRATQHVGYDYVGRFRGPSGGYPADYASGYGYWLGQRAMAAIATAPLTEDWAEDRWVANTLANVGISGYDDQRHYLACHPPVRPEHVFSSNIRVAAVFCEYPPHMMYQLYTYHNAMRVPLPPTNYQLVPVPLPARQVVNGKIVIPTYEPPVLPETYSPKSTLMPDLAIMIKTFMRDGYLFDCLDGLLQNFAECKLIITDDGFASAQKDALYKQLTERGHIAQYLPFDSGFGEKGNASINLAMQAGCKYMLVGSDDFDFADPTARASVEKMYKVITGVPDLACASGRVDGNPYEAMLERRGNCVREIPLQMGDWLVVDGVDYKLCDLTVNFSILRVAYLGWGPEQVHWDGGTVKIGGGEHGAFFLDLKEQGRKVAFVPGCQINSVRYNPRKEDPRYASMRGRARSSPRTCLINRGLKCWVSRDGDKDNF